MSEPIVIYQGPDACQRCLGWKRVANSDDGESWKYWAELRPPENLAVTLGVVRPVVCPRCGGTGREPDNASDALRALEQRLAAEADEIKALLIEMRRYFISRNCPVGECVAWNELKARFGVGVRDEVDEAWMAAHTGKPFQLRRSADERKRARGE